MSCWHGELRACFAPPGLIPSPVRLFTPCALARSQGEQICSVIVWKRLRVWRKIASENWCRRKFRASPCEKGCLGGSNWIKVIGLVTCLDIFAIPKSEVVIAKIKGLWELLWGERREASATWLPFWSCVIWKHNTVLMKVNSVALYKVSLAASSCCKNTFLYTIFLTF